jgi:multidrug efflux pump
MCSKLLRSREAHGRLYLVIERGLERLIAGYRWALARALKVRPLILLAGAGVTAAGVLIFPQLSQELAPYEDQGAIFGIFQSPEGATIDYTDRYAYDVEKILVGVPEVERFFVISGFPDVSQGVMFAILKPWGERGRVQSEITAEIGAGLYQIPGVLAFAVNPPPLGQSPRVRPVEFVIRTTQPYTELKEMMDKVVAKAEAHGGFRNIDTDLRLNKPQIRVVVDRDKAADLGVSAEILGRTLETLFGGRQVTRFKREGKQYDVLVRVAEPFRTTPVDLSRVYVRGADEQFIQVANLVRIEETVGPRALNHFNQLRSATISANLAPGFGLGEALEVMRRGAEEAVPSGAQFDYAGQSREFQKASGGIAVTFVLALAFIYLVLAAQFESFRSPLIILLTVPLSITGGLLALYLDGSTLNIYSQVGLVTLIGLISKHGILIVEFANQNRSRGLSVHDAVLESCAVRLRPILMTTGAMVFGALPLAVASGAGAESRQDIGLVIVGGLVVGTFFTLFVIPAVYTYITPRVHRAVGADDAGELEFGPPEDRNPELREHGAAE